MYDNEKGTIKDKTRRAIKSLYPSAYENAYDSPYDFEIYPDAYSISAKADIGKQEPQSSAQEQQPQILKDPAGNDVTIPAGAEVLTFDGNRLIGVIGEDEESWISWNEEGQFYEVDPYGRQKYLIWMFAEEIASILSYGEDLLYEDSIKSAAINYALQPTKTAMQIAINESDPTWVDLGNAFMYELELDGGKIDSQGFYNIIIDGQDKYVNKDLSTHEGVEQVREQMKDKVREGQTSGEVSDSWGYNLGDLNRNLGGDWQWREVFLGSYRTTITWRMIGKDLYQVNYLVENESTLASATRFRRKDGKDVGMARSKPRNVGVEVGGNMRQNFIWSENLVIR